MISFTELNTQVHTIKDLILADMMFGQDDDHAEESLCFSKHLFCLKYWFVRISWSNKKRYLFALLEDVRNAWTLSLLLKSIWNCRPKDAVLSANQKVIWSSYDQVPMDHNRTALPESTLVQVMKNDRQWFLTLDPEHQAIVLSELLTVAGGPIMWEVHRRAQNLYERYRDRQLRNILDCTVVHEKNADVFKLDKNGQENQTKKETPQKGQSAPTATVTHDPVKATPAQKELEENLAAWNATIKTMKDSLKLEEMEMTYNDGTKQKIWKINRPKPEAIETTDFLQLLPSYISKQIISMLSRSQWGDLTKVNRYWAYLVDELKAEQACRLKLDVEFNKLHDVIRVHDTSLDIVPSTLPDLQQSLHNASISPSVRKHLAPSIRASEKTAYSFRHFLSENMNKPPKKIIQKPIRNLAELTDRLNMRGAADEKLWDWCTDVLRSCGANEQNTVNEEGVLSLGTMHFPCPLLKQRIRIPLNPPLYKDPTASAYANPKNNISNSTLLTLSKEKTRRYTLWSRDFSKLYSVVKLPSYQSPV